jgi:hypothetical protein
MSTKRVIASYAVELTEDENGCLWTTATRQELFEDCFARHVTAMFLGTYGMTQKQWSELRPTLGSLLRYRS